ncbi:MAG: HmuY family protein [Bacteroidetes bacterium]|nr:HmuY family protein [Bacteroidota bacterium]
MRSLVYAAIAATVFTSCEPEEPLYPAPKQIQGLQTLTLDMGEDRNRDVFVNLSNVAYSSADGSLWDLGFSCVSGRWDIIINNGNDAWIYRGDTGSINRVFKVPSTGWRYDNPTGTPDSSALGSWSPDGSKSYGYCYIMDRGLNQAAADRYVKFKLGRVENGDYVLSYGRLADTVTKPARIGRMPGKNYAYFSFLRGDTIHAEPLNQDAWDLVFRKYKTNIIETGTGIPYDYVAVGCLLNPYNTLAVEVPANTPFESVNLGLAQSLTLSARRDAIGYDWKLFDRLSGKYTVNYKRVYVIRTAGNQWFKLRFTDYYNDLGQRGYPKFEFERL